MWNGQICKKLDVGSRLSCFSTWRIRIRDRGAARSRVGAFGVGKRQQLRKDVELVLVRRIDDRAYLFSFH